jgi:hypothetical protein
VDLPNSSGRSGGIYSFDSGQQKNTAEKVDGRGCEQQIAEFYFGDQRLSGKADSDMTVEHDISRTADFLLYMM